MPTVRAGRWDGVPVAARRVVLAAAAALGYGAVVHLVHLVLGGLDPYPSVPGWLAIYFVSLTMLDPIAALLLLLRRRAGLVLGCAVLITDAAANGYANYVADDSAVVRDCCGHLPRQVGVCEDVKPVSELGVLQSRRVGEGRPDVAGVALQEVVRQWLPEEGRHPKPARQRGSRTTGKVDSPRKNQPKKVSAVASSWWALSALLRRPISRSRWKLSITGLSSVQRAGNSSD